MALLSNLRHRIPFEIVAEIGLAHHGIMASWHQKFGQKASTNLEAIEDSPEIQPNWDHSRRHI